MNTLVGTVNRMLGKSEGIGFRLPYSVGFMIGKAFDVVSAITGKRFSISSIRVKKFCANSMFNTNVTQTGFVAPVSLAEAMERTVRYEFVETHDNESVFYSE